MAKQLLDAVISENKDEKAVQTLIYKADKKLNVIVELVVGRFQDQVQRMVFIPKNSALIQIEIYSPDSLIVGTRGRDGAIGGLFPGSMSK